MKWTVRLEGGPRRVNHAAVAVGDKVFSFGGYVTGDNYKDTKPIDVFILNAHNYRWSSLIKPKLGSSEARHWPYQRYGHTVVEYNSKIFLFGGRNDLQPCNIVYCFDTVTFEWSQPSVCGLVPAARDGHSAVVYEGSMYIFGGYEDSVEPFRPDVYKLDLNQFEWTLVKCQGIPPIYRDFHTATAIDNKMYVFGGRSDTTAQNPNHNNPFLNQQTEFYSDKLVYLDMTTSRWETPVIASPKPTGRRSHSAINLDGKLLIFGGYNGRRKEHMNDLWLFDPSSLRWKELRPMGDGPDPRRRQAMCKVVNQIFLFGGTSPHDGPQIFFTPDQQQYMLQPSNLIDHNDVYVLDLSPSLRTLCLDFIIQNQNLYDLDELPPSIRYDFECMTKDNNLSEPLPFKTLPLG